MAHDVFISYSSIDKVEALAACATFEAAGIRCWIAPRDVPGGGEWAEAIIDAIEGARIMVLLFSANSNESRQVRREIELAVSRGLTIMPLRLEQIQPTKSMAYYMAGIHWIDALAPPLENHLKRMVEWIKPHLRDGTGPEMPPEPPPKAKPKAEPKSKAEPKPEPKPKAETPPPPPPKAPPRPEAAPKRGSNIFSDMLYEFFGVGVPKGGMKIGEAGRAIDAAVKLGKAGKPEEAIAAYLALIERIDAAPAAPLDWNLAIATLNLGVTYRSIGKLQDAVNAYRDVVRRVGDTSDELIQKQVAMALNNWASTLIDLGKAKDALPVYDDVLSRFGESYNTDLNIQVAMARYGRGVAFGALGRNAEAVAAYDEAIARIDLRVYPMLDEWVALSVVNKGTRLNAMGRSSEALTAYEQAVTWFGASKDMDKRQQVAKALANISSLLIDLKRYDEGFVACDKVIARPRETIPLMQMAAIAMRNKVAGLNNAGRLKDAAVAADRMLAEFGSSSDLQIAENAAAVRKMRTTL
ncbi:MAG: TIR domain-containing protein [Devosia sp.]